MSISKQLITMLLIAILGIIAVFSIGMTKMEHVYAKTNTCNVNSLPSILLIGDLQQAMYRMRIVALQHMESDDLKTQEALEEKFNGYKRDFEKANHDYERLISDAKDRGYYEKEKEYFNKYTQIVNKIFTLSKEGKKEEIKQLIAATAEVPQTLTKTTDEHMDDVQEDALRESQEAAAEKNSASSMMIGLSLIVALSVIVLGVMIRNNVMQ
ncbi:MAG TPA: chemotaxis protein, partial [Sulfurospirillum cavolei]